MPTLPRRAAANALLPFALLIGISCSERQSVEPAARAGGGSSRDISDGATGGNARFFFLPPLVRKSASIAGVTDATRSPTVTICEWVAAQAACANVVARFQPGDVTYDADGEQYAVNWKVSGVDAAKSYRLRVDVGDQELGHLDLVVATTGAQVNRLQSDDRVAVLAGRMLPIKFRIEQGAVVDIPVEPVYDVTFSAGPVGGGQTDIFRQRTDAPDASRVNLTNFFTLDNQSPRWSSDGSRLLFTSQHDGPWELYMSELGGAPRRMTFGGGLTANADISPVDRSAAVFMRGYRIWRMNLDAPNPEATAVQITSTPFDENQPMFSPNGQWIAWVRQPRAGTDVWVMRADDPSQAFQVTDLDDYARHPSWSPDGTKIVFSRLWDIYIADVIDNSDPAHPRVRALNEVQITRLTTLGNVDMPVWSPDGRRIVFSGDAGGQADLFIMHSDGSSIRAFTSTAGINEYSPAFTPRRP
jgi:hypothetical protein